MDVTTTILSQVQNGLLLILEMAYGIMGNMPSSRMLSYRTTRDVKAIYFDGASANLMGSYMNSQMAVLCNGTENLPGRWGWGGGCGDDQKHMEKNRKGDGPPSETSDDPPKRPPPRWNPLADEYFRARGLCEWLKSRGLGGVGWGYEGIVRMNAGFELIWCNFESPSLKMVSNLNVSAPYIDDPSESSFEEGFQGLGYGRLGLQERLKVQDEGPHGPGLSDPREPFRNSSNWLWFAAAAKRYHEDRRIKVDSCGVFSFYDPELQDQSTSRLENDAERLNLTADGRWQTPEEELARMTGLDKLMKRRRQHVLDRVGEQDAEFMLQALEKRLERVLKTQGGYCGLDWHYIAREIASQYSTALRDLSQSLGAGITILKLKEGSRVQDWLRSARQLTHWFVMPFLEYPPDRPYKKKDLKYLFSLKSSLAKLTLERCKSQYEVTEADLDIEEMILYKSIRETLAGICNTVVEVGLGVEYHWLLQFNKIPLTDGETRELPYDELHYFIQSWKTKIEELMAWLGWVDRWTSCDPTCGVGEICYIPMWPTSGWPRRRRPPLRRPDNDAHLGHPHAEWEWGESVFLWKPVCVNASTYPPEEWD